MEIDYDAMYEDPTYILAVKVMQSEAYLRSNDLREAADNAYSAVRAKYAQLASADAAHRAREEAVRPSPAAVQGMIDALTNIRRTVQQELRGAVAKDIFDFADLALAALTHPAHSDAGAGSGEERK